MPWDQGWALVAVTGGAPLCLRQEGWWPDSGLGPLSSQMAIVFNQEGLSAIQPPCVVQNFINHNAVLYKVFVVGESYTVVQRPSLKNFSAGTSGKQTRTGSGCPELGAQRGHGTNPCHPSCLWRGKRWSEG